MSPNHTYCKRFPFDPDIDFSSRDDEIFEITKKTADMIKSYGALPIGELLSTGEIKTYIGDGINPKGPSEKDLEDGITHVDAFTKEEIKEHIQEHIDACKWFRDAGWEGIMIHCGHGWLPAQFLSPVYNKREDEYGGSFENRARFTTELLSAVREAMGPDFMIEIRVSGEEHLPGGLVLEDAVKYCKMCEPYIDLIHVPCGHYLSSSRSWEFTTPYAPHGANIENASIIKQNVSVPVAVVGGINSPEMAEEAIASGKVDMISMGRQFFADPAFPNKAKEGHADEIRRCLRCGRCYPGPSGEHETEKWTIKFPPLDSCTINPYDVWPASHHKIMPELMPEPQASRKVLVIGGGLVGCEAAADYIEHGIETTIVEMQECLMPETTGLYRTAVHDFIDHNGGKYEVNAKVVKVGKDFVIAEQNGKEIEIKADTVVNAMGRRAHGVEELKAAISVPVWEIGDGVKARQIGDAIREAWTAAMEII